MEDIELTVQYVTPSWNKVVEINDWRTRKGIVDRERANVAEFLMAESLHLKDAPEDNPVDIAIRHYKRHPYDSDNVIAKFWIDAMIDIDFLEDDSCKHVNDVTINCLPLDEGKKRTEITITEYAED